MVLSIDSCNSQKPWLRSMAGRQKIAKGLEVFPAKDQKQIDPPASMKDLSAASLSPRKPFQECHAEVLKTTQIQNGAFLTLAPVIVRVRFVHPTSSEQELGLCTPLIGGGQRWSSAIAWTSGLRLRRCAVPSCFPVRCAKAPPWLTLQLRKRRPPQPPRTQNLKT